jgi:hypothetical protein
VTDPFARDVCSSAKTCVHCFHTYTVYIYIYIHIDIIYASTYLIHHRFSGNTAIFMPYNKGRIHGWRNCFGRMNDWSSASFWILTNPPTNKFVCSGRWPILPQPISPWIN